MKTLRKNLKKIGHKHIQVFNTRTKIRQEIILFVPCTKRQICGLKNVPFNTTFCQRFCLFCTGHKMYSFLSKFYMSVKYLYMFVPNFFQIFSKRFHIFQISKTKPGAHAPGHQNAVLLSTCLYFIYLFCLTPLYAAYIVRAVYMLS